MNRILITGAGGFVGGALIQALRESGVSCQITGLDNFSRPGSELSRTNLRRLGIRLIHGDLRCASDVAEIPAFDWVIDCAANPSVLAGADGSTSSRQLLEHNLFGTVNLLERCRSLKAGFILLSTSRVYSIQALSRLPVVIQKQAFALAPGAPLPAGVDPCGVTESFSTTAPISLYGASKLASEALALEYGETFGFPVWLNRCGVLAGAGQFGRPDQGIFSYWLHSHRQRRKLRYLGFDGTGHQVRDCLHPRDLIPLILQQWQAGASSEGKPRVVNVGGGIRSARSLRQLTEWCDQRFGTFAVEQEPRGRPFDIPWLILNPTLAHSVWNWEPQTTVETILEEIARHAETTPDWLDISAPD